MTASEESDATLALAKCVAAEAAKVGIPTAVIGAMALAADGYVRATEDVIGPANFKTFTVT